MKLTRPVIWFDLESTGVDTETARIVQIAALKVYPDGKTEEKDILINPTIPIPLEASEVHGITDEMVKDKPTFQQYAKAMKGWFEGSDLAGFNSDIYDVPLLMAEMAREGLTFADWDLNLLDVLKLYRQLFPNTLGEIYKRLFNKELDGAHNALIDILATKEIFEHICPEELTSPKEVDEFLQGDKKRFDIAGKCYVDGEGTVRWSFSKNKDLPVLQDNGFLLWFMKQDFPQESKDKIKELQQKTKEHE